MSLSNKQLILLDTLAYYSAFSDINALPSSNTVADIIDYIENRNKNTCFNGIAGLSDHELGMDDIRTYIKSDPTLMRLKVVYPSKSFDMTTSASACLVDPVSNEVYVIFGGNYAPISQDLKDIFGEDYAENANKYNGKDMDVWADNFIGAFVEKTEEQKRALDFYKEAVSAARDYFNEKNIDVSDLDITVSGHSAAGNMAQYVTVMYDGPDSISRCVSVDGQDFSQEFIDKHSSEIAANASKITSILPSTSIVGSLMNRLPGIQQIYIDVDCVSSSMTQINGMEELIRTHMPAELFDSNGVLRQETTPSFFTLFLNDVTKKIVLNLCDDDDYNLTLVVNDLREVLIKAFNGDLGIKDIPDYLSYNSLEFLEELSKQLSNEFNVDISFNAEIVLFESTLFGGALSGNVIPFLASLIPIAAYATGIIDLVGDVLFETDQLIRDQLEYISEKYSLGTYGDFEYHAFGSYQDWVEHEIQMRDIRQLSVNDAVGEISGTNNNDYIYIGMHSDEVHGGNGDDVIISYNLATANFHGDDGNDYLIGGSAVDTLYGDDGNDTIHGNGGNDNIDGGSGFDHIFGGDGVDTIVGGEGNDIIYGDAGDDRLYGGDDDDVLYGALEENGNGENTDSRNLIVGEKGNDTIYGGAGIDIIYGDLETRDSFDDDGNDIIYGNTGDDTIFGGGSNDTIDGGVGTDRIYGGDGKDTINGGIDKDFIYGEDDVDTINGGSGNDIISGGDDGDKLYGGADDDVIFGGDGWDDLDGGHGDDTLRGGDRSDTYYFRKSNGSDNIYDQYGTNTVVFEGIELSDLSIAYAGAYQQDLVFTIASTGETLTIIDYMHTADSFKYKFDDESGYYTVEDNDGVLSFEKIESSHSGSGYDTHWDKLLDNTSNNNIDIYESATVAQPPRDPLVIDLGEDGIELTTIDDGVYFDLDKNGFAEKTAWIGTEDGFLVLDRNGNGLIDDGGELFSDQVVMSNGEISSSGFSALADLDDNTNESENSIGDGIIDEKDAEFKNLRVWIDANHNGITDEGELKSLDELEIVSISLNHVQTNTVDSDTGTIITETSEVVFKNGTVREISEHWFQINSADTEEINVTNIDDDLTSFGNMHSLSYALENDTSGELQELVDSFMSSDNYVDKRVIARKILYYITDSSDITVNSRGGAIDARNLHVLETIMGVDTFVGVNGSTTPNSNAASILNQLFSDFDRTYFVLLNEVLGEADYLELIEEIPDDNGEIILDLSAVEDIVDHYISLGINVDEMLFNIGVYLKSYDSTYGTDYLNSFKSHYSDRADEIGIMANGNFVVGTEGNDTLNGSSSQDVIWAESGDDNISTGAGNDLIYSGTGNDTINAGAGADIVYGEDGNDIINADSGSDTIYAGTGDDTIKAGSDNDLVYGEDGNDTIDGGTGNDTLYSGTGDDTINAGEGDDVVYGEDGNDIIDGGAGNDTVDAGTGNDVINGGEGDDTLAGGEGDDTYHFSAAHGNDIVFDADGANMLEFGDELSADDYDLSVDINGGFVLTHKETGETISLPDFVTNPLAYDFSFAGEGKVLGGGEEREVLEGTDEDNTLNAGDGFNIIYGNGGNDIIEGGENLDFVFGGDGDDTISGGNGTNILHGEAGNDTLNDGEGSSYLNGGDGDDTLFAGAGNDVLLGGTGADEMHGEDGDDVLAGNEGDDTLYGEAGADTLYADAGNDTLYGGDDDDSLFGGDGDDILHGDDGNDYLESGNGNNTMYGGEGDDTFVTGEDTDYVYGGTGNDYVIGGNGDNYIYGEDGNDRLQGGEGYDYMEGGLGNDNLSGGNGFNEMYGQEGDDYIYGGDHADYIDGGVGNDHLYGANATDGQNEIYGREGNDTIYDGDQGAYIEGNEGDDTIRAGGGNDVIDGGVGNDYIQDDHGDDTVIFKAGYGTDTISDAAGNNTLVLSDLSIEDATVYKEDSDLKLAFSTGDNLIIKQYFDGGAFQNFSIDGVLLGDLISGYHGTENDDWMSASNGNDTTLYGDGGNDNISGNNGSDTLYGDSGDDTLNGGENADMLDGGEGTDSLYGGNGDDTYVFGKGYGSDTIEDWNGSSIVKLTDINIDEVSISNSNDSALVLTVDSTGDTLTINGYKWNQGGYTFEFADGTTDTVNKDTWNWESGFGTSSDDTTGEGETTQPDADVTDGYVLNGSANGEWLSAPNNNDGVIDAGDGDDGLNGGSGNDKLYGGVGTDNLYGNDGDDILDGGTGNDVLNGGNGTDTYIFAKGYGNDSINEWGTDKSIVKFTDINSDEVTLNSQSENNLVISVNGTSDTLTISNYRWSQGSFTLEFADGAIATVNKETWEMEYSQYPTLATEETAAEVSEDEIAQTNAELLTELYAEDALSTELISETENTIISDVTDSTTVADESDEVADQTDLQVMILTENMSAFADEDNVSDGINVADASADVTAMNQFLVNSAV